MQHIYKPRTAFDLFWRPYVCISVESDGRDVTLYVKMSPISGEDQPGIRWTNHNLNFKRCF